RVSVSELCVPSGSPGTVTLIPLKAYPLEANLCQIFVTRLGAGEGVLRGMVLDEVMLNAGLLGLRKDFRPFNDSAAHFGHLVQRVAEILSTGRIGFRNLGQVFHV